MIRNPYQQYKHNQIQTAHPHQLILMLYEGAIKNLYMARQALDKNDFATTNTHLLKAQDIVLELQYSLNEGGGDIADGLNLLYDYIYRQLLEANISKDIAIIQQILGMLKELKETWAEAMQLVKRKGLS